MQAHQTLDRFLLAITTAGTTTVAIGVAMLLTDNVLGGFLAPALAGGLLLAIVLFVVNRHTPAPIATHDPFADPSFNQNILNVAHVRVAGVGGLALIGLCAVVTWQYQLIAAAMVAGVIGGAAAAWILVRRRSGQGLRP
jgi:hypothetical protein